MTFAGTSANGQDAPFSAVPCGSGRGVRSTRSGHSRPLFDHLVGAGEQRLRHGEAERLGGLHIDDELELGRLLDGQVGRLRPREDLSSVTKPLLLSHTAMAGSYAMGPTPLSGRQISPDPARAIAETGGSIGIWHFFPSL